MGKRITPNTNFLSTLNSGAGTSGSPTSPPDLQITPTPSEPTNAASSTDLAGPATPTDPTALSSETSPTTPTPTTPSSSSTTPITSSPAESPSSSTTSTTAPAEEASEQNSQPTPKPPHRWIRLLRAFLWLLCAIALPIGLALHSYSETPSAFASGTSDALAFWSNIIFWPSLVLTILNFIWGAIRWFTRWHRERWHIGHAIGKIIGGGIWRTAVFAPIILISLLLITPSLYRTIHQTAITTSEQAFVTSDSLLLADYETGQLTSNQYLNYLIDSFESPSSLPEQYQGNSPTFLPDYLHFTEQHLDELETSTIKRVYDFATLSNVQFGTDASNNLSANHSLFSQNAHAAMGTNVMTLNRAKLSSNQHFIVFYTDIGINAVSDADVDKLCEMLERILSNYQSKLGIDYDYQSFSVSADSTLVNKQLIQVLKNNNIITDNNLDIFNTAMPVYLVDPFSESSSILAFYMSTEFAEIIMQLGLTLVTLLNADPNGEITFAATLPSFPAIVIRPSNLHNEDLEGVTAHELGHHYATTYCSKKYNKNCETDNFIGETIADWLAIHVADNIPANNVTGRHYNLYLKYGYCYNIDTTLPDPPAEHACHRKGKLEGYPAIGFLETYSEIVPNSQELFFQAVALGDAHYLLYSQAGIINYRQIMITLAERSLTKDFHQDALKNGPIPTGEDIPCNDLCTQKYYIAPSSTRYLYFPTSAFARTVIDVNTPAFNAVSILGRKNGVWHVIESNLDNATYEITGQADFDVIAFAVANFSLDQPSEFQLDVTAADLEEIIDDEPTISEINLPITVLSDNCIGINVESVLDLPAQIYRILNQFSSSPELMNSIQKLEADSTELKKELTFHYATVCANYLKPHLDYRTARLSIRKTFRPSLEILNLQDEDSNSAIGIIISANPLLNEAKAHILVKPTDEDTLQLLTIHMYEKLPRF